MLTERDENALRILADAKKSLYLRAFERDAVRAALEEIERLQVEIARLRGDGA